MSHILCVLDVSIDLKFYENTIRFAVFPLHIFISKLFWRSFFLLLILISDIENLNEKITCQFQYVKF